MLEAYRQHVADRAAQSIPPAPLSPEQVADLLELLKNPPAGEEAFLVELLTERVPPGVDEAAYVKAGFLSALANGETSCDLIDREHAIRLLGDMHGGYNIATLVGLLDDAALGTHAARELKQTLLVFDAFHDVVELANGGSKNAQAVLESWAAGEWFTDRPEVPE
ncbi:MAG: aconitate hydratase B, partial [Luminiphilus sp.]